jgi:hypothetical protein
MFMGWGEAPLVSVHELAGLSFAGFRLSCSRAESAQESGGSARVCPRWIQRWPSRQTVWVSRSRREKLVNGRSRGCSVAPQQGSPRRFSSSSTARAITERRPYLRSFETPWATKKYAGQVQVDSLMIRPKEAMSNNAVNTDLADLQGCRFVSNGRSQADGYRMHITTTQSSSLLLGALVEAVRRKQWERARRLVGADALCHHPDAGQLACANGAHRSNIAFLIALSSN